MSKQLTELIEDIEFLRDKADEPLVKVAYNIAITIIKTYLAKSLQSEAGWISKSLYVKETKAELISKEDALRFAEWMHKRECKYWYSLTRNSFIGCYTNKEITTEELFKIFKNQQ